jgi:hypothetical protein
MEKDIDVMSLIELYNSNQAAYNTDKETTHSYISSYYSNEFSPVKNNSIQLLEIGIAAGGSIKLWSDWFTNGVIYGIDCNHIELHTNNSKLYFRDAYEPDTADLFLDNFFDYIIDDGPHTIVTQLAVIPVWLPKLKVGGKLIIEDIQHFFYVSHIEKVSNAFGCHTKIFDLRHNGRSGGRDDVIIEITKT